MARQNEQLLKDAPRRERPGMLSATRAYFTRHLQVLLYSLGQLWRSPFSMMMTAAVIGIALALPTGLHVLLQNAQNISGGWDGAARLSLFLHTTTTDEQARQLKNRIQQMPEVSEVDYISREMALDEFKQKSGFGEALTALNENPLPAVLIVTPQLQHSDASQVEQLAKRLREDKYVELAQLDQEWIKRLYAIMDIVGRGVLVLGAMLALAVLLVVGNTIRLAIQNRRDEIVIIKLIGGTDAFIRRPFLYTGFWYGLFGGLLAMALVYVALWAVESPVERLAGMYQSTLTLQKLDPETITILLLTSIGLGLGGSWLAVGRHLRAIEPR